MDVCSGHILESTKGIEKKLVLQIDGSERKGSAQGKIIIPCIFTVLSPLTIFFIMDSCLGHILESTKGIEIKLGT